MQKVFIIVLSCLLFLGCPLERDVFDNQIDDVGFVDGMKPVYASLTDWQNVTVSGPIPIEKLGKIYYKSGFIFVNEKYKGIHVINNTDPSNPEKIKFIEIVGNKDIAIKGNRLYADNYTDLITLDISDLDNVAVLSRVKNIYPAALQNYPPSFDGYFECVDNTVGIVIGWEEVRLENPDCWK